jgi:hypothetical protein
MRPLAAAWASPELLELKTRAELESLWTSVAQQMDTNLPKSVQDQLRATKAELWDAIQRKKRKHQP